MFYFFWFVLSAVNVISTRLICPDLYAVQHRPDHCGNTLCRVFVVAGETLQHDLIHPVNQLSKRVVEASEAARDGLTAGKQSRNEATADSNIQDHKQPGRTYLLCRCGSSWARTWTASRTRLEAPPRRPLTTEWSRHLLSPPDLSTPSLSTRALKYRRELITACCWPFSTPTDSTHKHTHFHELVNSWWCHPTPIQISSFQIYSAKIIWSDVHTD